MQMAYERHASPISVLMSIFKILKQRGFQGTDIVIEALRQCIAKKSLPTPPKIEQTTEQVQKNQTCRRISGNFDTLHFRIFAFHAIFRCDSVVFTAT
jgi:hypothetical protein